MITDQDYATAAALLGCEVAVIKAVDKTESKENGFLPTGELKILFEPSQMWSNLKAVKINPTPYSTNPKYKDVCYEKWKTYPYGKYSEQWERLNRAAEINKEAAYKSASWGRYQVMGMYHKECGFDSVFALVEQYKKSEGEHLMGFIRMVRGRGLDKALKEKNWQAFKDGYNGKGANDYVADLQSNYDKSVA